MTALEQLGGYVAGARCGPQADAELLELHLIDTVGAWIAGAGTTEGAALLRFRAEPDAATVERDLATRCALARLSEIDDIHLRVHDNAGRDRHSRRADAGGVAARDHRRRSHRRDRSPATRR